MIKSPGIDFQAYWSGKILPRLPVSNLLPKNLAGSFTLEIHRTLSGTFTPGKSEGFLKATGGEPTISASATTLILISRASLLLNILAAATNAKELSN